MNIYIQTRGIQKDYCFLVNEPKQNWWQEQYASYTSFEHPTVIVENQGEKGEKGWRIYLSGAKCSRQDKVNTPIRYSFVLENAEPITENELMPILALIQNWLAAIYSEDAQKELQAKLDELFNQDTVELYIELSMPQEKTKYTVEQYIELKQDAETKIPKQFLDWLNKEYSNEFELSDFTLNNCQIGAVNSDKIQKQFLQHCAALLNGKVNQPSSAVYLNFIETEKDLNSETVALRDEEQYPRQFMILVNDTEQQLKDALKSVEIKKKDHSHQKSLPSPQFPKYPNGISGYGSSSSGKHSSKTENYPDCDNASGDIIDTAKTIGLVVGVGGLVLGGIAIWGGITVTKWGANKAEQKAKDVKQQAERMAKTAKESRDIALEKTCNDLAPFDGLKSAVNHFTNEMKGDKKKNPQDN